jgi:hypothetical protein
VKCTLCGYEFNEEQARGTCRGCAFSKGCDLVKCPNCGMDIPRTPKWIEKLKSRIAKKRMRSMLHEQRSECP